MSTQFLKLKVKKVVRETADAISIHFDTPAGYSYKPGQFLTLVLPINGHQVRRAYSLFTSPYTDTDWAVTVKRVDNGLVSNYLNDSLKPGDTVDVMPPLGNFTTEVNPANQRHLVLFGGGSGITPLMSLAKSVLAQESGSEVSLVYANRDINSVIFRETIEQLKLQYGGRFSVVHILEASTEGWTGLCGRLSHQIIEDILQQLPKRGAGNTEYFVCGPEGMMDCVVNTLHALNVPKDTVHKESFSSTIDEAAKQAAVEEEGIRTQSVKVIVDGSEFTFAVEPNQTILEAALDQDIDLPYSCQSGLCTACRGKALSGKVYLDESEGLSDREIEAGYVLTCVGHPLTSDVVIEIG
jgi:ring-1,2-phenylacetyl-CoA epoxidase subunit PaaE